VVCLPTHRRVHFKMGTDFEKHQLSYALEQFQLIIASIVNKSIDLLISI
jgi:hypothetical protein